MLCAMHTLWHAWHAGRWHGQRKYAQRDDDDADALNAGADRKCAQRADADADAMWQNIS